MRNFIIKWNSTVHFTHTDVIFPPSIARIISLSLCKSYYGYQCLFFFHKKGKKKRYSRFDVETKLTHWFLFFISVKFPRVANIHFLQSASNYVIRENFSKKKKTKSHLKNLRIRIKKIFYRFILFWISWKFWFPFWKVRDNLIR